MLITQKLDVKEKTGCRFGFSTPKLPKNCSELISYKNFVEQCNLMLTHIQQCTEAEAQRVKTAMSGK